MPFPTSHGAFACCGFKASVQVIKKKKIKKGGGMKCHFWRGKKYFRLFGVSHKGLFVHRQSVQCQEKSLAQGGVTLSEIKFWPPFTSNTLRLIKKKKEKKF